MSDSSVAVTEGSGKNIDTRTESISGDHRQVVVLGDPTSGNAVASVQATDPSSNTEGIVVRDVNTSAMVARLGQTIFVQLDPGHSLGTVIANAGTGTFTVAFDPGHELGTIKGNSNTLTVFLPDTGHEIGTIRGNTNTLTVFLPDTGHEIGSIRGIANSINVYLGATAGTLIVKVDPATTVFTNSASTANIFTVSGSTSGVSVSGVQLVAPSANASFKVFAFSLQTTGIVSTVARFTNGGGSATEYFRGLVTANQTSSTPIGANLAVQPPGYLFATGTNTTLALHLDTATLVHYSVSYFKETA